MGKGIIPRGKPSSIVWAALISVTTLVIGISKAVPIPGWTHAELLTDAGQIAFSLPALPIGEEGSLIRSRQWWKGD